LCGGAGKGRDRDRRRAAGAEGSRERRRARCGDRCCAGQPVAVGSRRRRVQAADPAAQARLCARAGAHPLNRQAAEKRGRWAETLACWYLRLNGWRILARRARVPGGEVDVIARRGRTLAFVEVKARASDADAAFALDRSRLKRVAVAAERLAPRYMRE